MFGLRANQANTFLEPVSTYIKEDTRFPPFIQFPCYDETISHRNNPVSVDFLLYRIMMIINPFWEKGCSIDLAHLFKLSSVNSFLLQKTVSSFHNKNILICDYSLYIVISKYYTASLFMARASTKLTSAALRSTFHWINASIFILHSKRDAFVLISLTQARALGQNEPCRDVKDLLSFPAVHLFL